MSELFRFCVLRPSSLDVGGSAGATASPTAANTTFVQDLVVARKSPTPRDAMIGLAQKRTAQDFPKSLSDYANGARLALALQGSQEERRVISAASDAQTTLARDREMASDVVIASAILGEPTSQAAVAANTVLRGLALLQSKEDQLELLRERLASAPVQLPGSIFPLPWSDDAEQAAAAKKDDEARTKIAEARAAAARDEIKALGELLDARTELQRVVETPPVPLTEAKVIPAPAGAPAPAGRSFFALRAQPTMSAAPLVRVDPARLAASKLALSATTVAALKSAGVDPEAFTVHQALKTLDVAERKHRTAIARSYPPVFEVQKLSADWRNFKAVYVGSLSPAVPGAAGPDDEPVPPNLSTTHGAVEKLVCVDLMVVHQVLARYEMGEIAHIENVLSGEQRLYRTQRTSTTETVTETETEKTTEEERDQQSTDRFELKRESNSVIQEDSSLKAGVSLSAKYGSVLEVNTNASGSLSQHKEESTRQSVTFSKDVTSRAASKVTERVRKLQSVKTTEQFVDINRHSFAADKNRDIIGIYQWVDKVYQAQVLNYGQRAMYNIVVPEPAAFWLDAFAQRDAASAMKPLPFELQPAQLSSKPGDVLQDSSGQWVDPQGNPLPPGAAPVPSDYMFYAARYQATGIKPVPALQTVVSKALSCKVKGGGGDAKGSTDVKDMAVAVPAGYVAVSAFVTGSWKADTADNWANGTHIIAIKIGGAAIWMNHKDGVADTGGIYPETILLLDPQGADPQVGTATEVGIGIETWNIEDYVLTVNVVCKLTNEAIFQWQLDTYGAIMQGYLKQQSDYDQKRTEAVQQAYAMRTFGTNPSVNRKIVDDEIKKSVISVISKQTFGWIGAITAGVPGAIHTYPQPDFGKLDVRASYIQFMEQSFEWEHMTYIFYPYFWGRKSGWYDKANLDDGDMDFLDFLRAGAARVVLPVRPGFEEAVAHFIDTKYLWNENNGGAMSPDLMAIVDEVRASADANDKPPTPVGTPWEVRVPTTLIKLRESSGVSGGSPSALSTLPRWIKNPGSSDPREAWLPAKFDPQTNTWVPDPSPQ